jgi:hypothetical protein
MRFLLFFGLLVTFFSCAENKKAIGDSLFPQMAAVDSIQVLFYDKEDEDRFYTYLINSDSSKISGLINDLRYDTIAPVSCTRQGKIYCFVDGAIYNTVYFNLDCKIPHFRYIKNARLYHFPMSGENRQQLAIWRNEAIAP